MMDERRNLSLDPLTDEERHVLTALRDGGMLWITRPSKRCYVRTKDGAAREVGRETMESLWAAHYLGIGDDTPRDHYTLGYRAGDVFAAVEAAGEGRG